MSGPTTIQSVLHSVEVGKGRVLARIVPLLVTVAVVALTYDVAVYRGLSDAQSIDNAQLARQIYRGQGFTTEFLRPHAVAQLAAHARNESLLTGASPLLFPADRFPPGTPRILPDTYNPPGYPCLLAAWFKIVHPNFDQGTNQMVERHFYTGDLFIPELNQIFIVLTALLIFALGFRLFDDRVAWMSVVAFLASDLIWKYSLTALPTLVLMFLVTGVLLVAEEIYRVAEDHTENPEVSFVPVWLWATLLGLLLGLACLTRLHLLILLAPLLLFLLLLPRTHFLLLPLVALVVIGMVAPWFWHVYKVSGSPLGSNQPLLLYGGGDYDGNQIYCTTSLPSYERLLRDAVKKELLGFRWHLEHGWNLLGSNPLLILFGASFLHLFKRHRARTLFWLIVGCAFCIVAANNLCSPKPEALSSWNTLVVLMPGMLVIGSAYFLVLLDRLNIHYWVLKNAIVVTILFLTAAPIALTLDDTNSNFYSYPPYAPPYINLVARFAQPDEWVTSDMPWATAWYADRASLWLPDSLDDFVHLHDNLCPTGVILFTPVTLEAPVTNLTSGEYKDWFPFISGTGIPSSFPLTVHTQTPHGGPEYIIWSDRQRWP